MVFQCILTLNSLSINNKIDDVKELMIDTKTDVLCLTETLHEDCGAICIKSLRRDGFQVLEREQPILPTATTDSVNYVNFGRIAFFASTKIRIEKASTGFDPTTFELLYSRISSRGAQCIVALLHVFAIFIVLRGIYQHGKIGDFHICPGFTTGDCNIRLDRPDESGRSASVRFSDIMGNFDSSSTNPRTMPAV